MHKNFDNLNDAFLSLLQDVFENGQAVSARGSEQKELLFCNFTIENPDDLNITSAARKFSIDYATSEWLWYLSANPKVNNIGKLAKIWQMIRDENGEAESNYGCYLKPQWNWVIEELVSDRDTRRATIVINQPHHKGKNKADYPCTHYLHFFIRDNKLHLGVNMRSNDIIFGLCNDVFTFSLFQQLMLNELNSRGENVELGTYNHHAGSLHLYERHYAMANKIILEEKTQPSETYKLSKSVTGWLDASKLAMPVRDLSKEEIKEHTKKVKMEIYS
jgi:thymidylate synthase